MFIIWVDCLLHILPEAFRSNINKMYDEGKARAEFNIRGRTHNPRSLHSTKNQIKSRAEQLLPWKQGVPGCPTFSLCAGSFLVYSMTYFQSTIINHRSWPSGKSERILLTERFLSNSIIISSACGSILLPRARQMSPVTPTAA